MTGRPPLSSSATGRWRLFRRAAALDIFGLSPVSSYPEFERGLVASYYPGGRGVPRGEWVRQIARTLVRGMVSWGRCLSSPLRGDAAPAFPAGGIGWVVRTRNQRASMEPIAAELGMPPESIDDLWGRRINRLATRHAFLFLPMLAVRFLWCNPSLRRTFRHSAGSYLRLYGTYIEARRSLERSRPALVVLGNDHVGEYNVIRVAAQDAGVPTVYIQHACVAGYFPPLRFDWALLDGRDAAEKYLTRPTEAKVFLVGIAKLDDIASRASCEADAGDAAGRDRRLRIGVCFNALDDEDFIEQTLETVREAFPDADVVARLHPATRPTIVRRVQQLVETLSVDLSDSRGQAAIDFVATLSVMVCGASSIILEAAAAGVPSVAYFSERATDVYGFVANGLCHRAENPTDLPGEIQRAVAVDRGELIKKVGFYSEGFGNPDWESSVVRSAKLIRKIAALSNSRFKSDAPEGGTNDVPEIEENWRAEQIRGQRVHVPASKQSGPPGGPNPSQVCVTATMVRRPPGRNVDRPDRSVDDA